LNEPERYVGATVAHGKEKWRETGREWRAEVRPGFEEYVDGF